jgi:hypothetical protein
MPRLAIDYSKTLIYKLVCNDLSIKECYVGHTTDFTRRKQCHKDRCHNEKGKYYNTKVYTTIRENGGWINWTMIEIEKYPCRDDNEARAKEREWYEILISNLNTYCPQRSNEENKNRSSFMQKQRYENNREEAISIQSQYRKDNREDILIKKKLYRENNKCKINSVFICQCGSQTTHGHKSNHFKTKHHLQYMERVVLSTDSTIPVVPLITDTQLVRGICYIPLEEFENIKQQKDINEDHLYSSNYYDYMHSHTI